MHKILLPQYNGHYFEFVYIDGYLQKDLVICKKCKIMASFNDRIWTNSNNHWLEYNNSRQNTTIVLNGKYLTCDERIIQNIIE